MGRSPPAKRSASVSATRPASESSGSRLVLVSTFWELSFALSGANTPSSTSHTPMTTKREMRPVVTPASAVIRRPRSSGR